MKKLLLCLFVLSLNNCYAGTGGASDGILFVLSIMMIMVLLLATGYLIDFLKARIKDAMTRRRLKKNMKEHEGEVTNLWDDAITGLEGLSSL